ncbi:MAG: InlB B-repeat-containing protein [Rhizobacter sp.]
MTMPLKIRNGVFLPLLLLFTMLLAACGGGGGGSSPPAATPYTIVYNANGSTGGGAPSDTKAYAANSSATVLGNTGALVKTGLAFAGWNTAADGSGSQHAPGSSLGVAAANVTLYAMWAPGYTVTYGSAGTNGGSVPVDGTTYVAGDVVTVPGNPHGLTKRTVPSTFKGWTGAINGQTMSLLPGDVFTMGTQNVVLQPEWTVMVSTLAGTGISGYANGIGHAATFDAPLGAVSDGTNLYVADSFNHAIRKVVIATGEVTTLAGSGSAGSTNGVGTAASFNRPYSVVTDGTHLYVADTDNNLVRKIDIATATVSTLAGSGAATLVNGTGTAASFNAPVALALDGGNLYVSDNYSEIRKIVLATGAVTTFAGATKYGYAEGVGTAAWFNSPVSMVVLAGNLYVAEYSGQRVRRVDLATATVSTLLQIIEVTSLATDGTDLYVGTLNGATIHKVDMSLPPVLTTLVSGGYDHVDGPPGVAKFGQFFGFAMHPSAPNRLFVIDGTSPAVREVR